MKEPPNRVDFSNTTGAVVECAARGSPAPDVIWVRADGTAVGDVPGLRQVLPNGNLVFPPFRAEDYRQEVHAQVYACLARNQVGTIHSRDVNVRAVVAQHYDTDVNKEYVIMGNSIILKCQVPSFVADFIEVLSWHTDEKEDFYPGENYVVQQQYESEVNNEYVIRGNSAILKCSIPSFVADFVNVISWHDEAENSYTINGTKEGEVVTQYYEAEVVSEYVIRGNTAVLKCNIPSFVADFVKVEAWVDSDGGEYLLTDDIVVNQFYEAEILTEYVIRGNSAVLKCSIPSFVADFVKVEAWIDEEGTEITLIDNLVVSQYYVTEAENEYVIRGNAAIVHCKIPSFVSDFVYVESWIMDDGEILMISNTNMTVVSQPYEAEADNEYVIRGNAAIMKCEVPSFVSDFVYVEMWTDSDGGTYFPGNAEAVLQVYEARVNDEFVLRGNTAILKCIVPSFVADFVYVVAWLMDNETVTANENTNIDSVVHQNYEPRVIDEDVLRGNSAIVKCLIPSFVADYVQVVEWLTDEESLSVFSPNDPEGNYAVNQFYESQVYDIYVIRGNAAVFKCHIPSFVSDHVQVLSWHDSEGGEYSLTENYVVSQAYTVNLVEENVLRGNAAIFKCLIPSFVTEYVAVSSWIISEGDDETEIQSNDLNKEVVTQAYTVNLMEESVLRGNAAILKCHISTFVTEYVSVSSWIISEADVDELEIKAESNDLVVSQSYTVNLWEENVLRGNSAILKCHIPSFVTEYVTITSWIISEGDTEELEINLDSDILLVVSQAYDVKFWEEYVLRGNAAILKCQIPSFVSEYVSVSSWIISEDEIEKEIKLDESTDLVVSQAYAVNLMEEYVLRGNAAIVKCHIPSFVSEYVTVVSWIVSEGEEEVEIKPDSNDKLDDGKYLVLPSGELHIRDVGPEDGYKSYQCRTKHRLTGETRLSATKGRLVITEPMGSAAPKVASKMIDITETTINSASTLLCMAQAFPVPVFSFQQWIILEASVRVLMKALLCCVLRKRFQFPYPVMKALRCCVLHKLFQFLCPEPINSAPPKVPTKTIEFLEFAMRSSITLLCLAQAYPVPVFRVPHFRAVQNWHGLNYPLWKILPFYVQRKGFLSQFLEPIGSKSPTFSTDNKLSWYVRIVGQSLDLACPAQAFPVPVFRYLTTHFKVRLQDIPCHYTEPIGSKSPTFSTDDKLSWYVRTLNQSIDLVCPAQAYPVPVFR
ncbi:Dscam [Danaus plexippus plexippus]|uniref:Dscam n=1 Tax=Danaus plexippus plexippus TaxID=278856 RepID=A0A212FJM7_DANPL|nr:Dscam [Danaus plexippus plexippus]